MNKSVVVGALLGLVIAIAGGIAANYAFLEPEVQEEGAQAPQQVCYDEQVTRPVEPKDEKRIAGTVIGALVGGAVGRDVGDRDLTTAAGAAAGAYAGNQVQKRMQENRTEATVETRCEPAAQ